MIPAPTSATVPSTHGCQPSPPAVANADSMILSLLQKPENGGTPRMASQPSPKVIQVTRMKADSPPKRRMSTVSPMPCITEPAPRNMPALKKPWVSRWKIANA